MVDIDAKARVLGSPAVQALSAEEFQERVDVIQSFADSLNLPATPEAVELLDLAFTGLLFSQGLLDS